MERGVRPRLAARGRAARSGNHARARGPLRRRHRGEAGAHRGRARLFGTRRDSPVGYRTRPKSPGASKLAQSAREFRTRTARAQRRERDKPRHEAGCCLTSPRRRACRPGSLHGRATAREGVKSTPSLHECAAGRGGCPSVTPSLFAVPSNRPAAPSGDRAASRLNSRGGLGRLFVYRLLSPRCRCGWRHEGLAAEEQLPAVLVGSLHRTLLVYREGEV